MTEKVLEEIAVGLSDAEKDDLEKMITAFREKSATPETLSDKDAQQQMLATAENLAQYGDILLKFDTKLKALHGILRLSDQKIRIMNHRIDAVVELLKGQNMLTEE